MGTYVNNLRLLEITTGDESGTWGTKTNTNLELIADAFGSGTEAITTNADTHTTTIADGAADEGRAIFLKYTGTLDSACTITIAPNTVNKLWFIENATSGSQNIIISQGSGANITIGNGKVAAVFTDGAGAGAAVLDAFADLELSSTLTVAGAITGSSTIQGTTITASTAFVPDASDGATLGTAALEFSDLFLADGGVVYWGDDQEISIVHEHNTGLQINGTNQIQFGDSGTYIHQSADGVLDLVSDTEIEINATTIDMNGAVDVSGTTTLNATLTVNAAAIFNEGSVNADFRVEGDGDAYLLYVDPGDDHVGIGVSAPHAKLTVKDAQDISMDSSGSGHFAITGNGYTSAIALDGSNMNIYNNASSIGIVFGTNETARMSIASGGTVNVVGEFTAGTKTFRIDHPLPSMTDTHTLSHASIEGPQADLMYRGSVDLQGGAATIDLDEAARMTSGTWAVLCRNPQVWAQNETGWTQVRGSVSGSTLTISAQDSDCTDTVSWLVVAERNDSHYTDSKSTDDDGLFRLERNKAESKENGE